MAHAGGLDADLKAQQDAKYDYDMEAKLTKWIEAVTGNKRDGTFAEWLQDGVVLCQLANRIISGIVPKIQKMKAPFKKMENIKAFLGAARRLGVMEASMFSTPDLFEEKNMGQVLLCLYSLAGVIKTTVPSFKGPFLEGSKSQAVEVRTGQRASQNVTQTGGIHSSFTKKQEESKVILAQEQTKEIDFNKAPKANKKDPKTLGSGTDYTELRGLDAELNAQSEAKRDYEFEDVVLEWIEAVTGMGMPGELTPAQWLKSGVVLCELANKIKPGSCTNVFTGSLGFKQMENIKMFLEFMRSVGVNESSMFSTLDLFEEKNMGIVMGSLYSLGGVIQVKVPEFPGPHLGVAINAQVKDEARANKGALLTDASAGFSTALEKDRPQGGMQR